MSIVSYSPLIDMPSANDRFVVKELHKGYVIASNGESDVILYKVDSVTYDDVIEVDGEFIQLHSLQNEHTFNFMKYMKRKGIVYQMNVKKFHILKSGNSLRNIVYKKLKKHKLFDVIQHVFYRISAYEVTSSYLLFIGGIHVVFLANFVSKLTNTNANYYKFIIALLYSLMFPVTFFIYYLVVSACVNIVFSKIDKGESVGLIIILLCFIKPSLVFEIGFIFYVSLQMFNLFYHHKLSIHIARSMLFIFLQLLCFNECSILFLFTYPFLRKLTPYLFTLLCISMVLPFAQNELLSCIAIFFYILEIIQSTNLVIIGYPHIWWCVLFLYSFIKCSYQFKKKYIIILFSLLAFQYLIPSFTLFGEIIVIDVGQGDCILIKEPYFGEVIMIDAAGSKTQDLLQQAILPVLKSKGIEQIDHLIVTHNDYDHSGSVYPLQQVFNVKNIYTSLTSLKTKYIDFKNLNTIVNPKDENDKSIVLHAKIFSKSYIFMGDASKEVEEHILKTYPKLQADVIKVGHHGSNTSTSNIFISTLQSQLALISVAKYNYYGHPHKEVLDTLHKQRVYTLSTSVEGSIHIYFSSYLHFFKTGTHVFGIIQ